MILAAVPLELTNDWALIKKADSQPPPVAFHKLGEGLKLRPGKCDVRVFYRPAGDLEAISNPVTIEITSAPRAEVKSGGVELVALTKFPTEGSPWWTPDGRLLTEPPVDPSKSDYRSSGDPKYIWYAALFRIPGGLDSVSMDSIQVTNGPSVGAGGQFRNSKWANDLAAIAFGVPKDAKQTDLTVQVAHGTWRTIAMVNGRRLWDLRDKETTSESGTDWGIHDRVETMGLLRLFVDYPQDNVQARVVFTGDEVRLVRSAN